MGDQTSFSTGTVTLSNCYDSHVHLLGTGEVASTLALFDLKGPQDLATLKPEVQHFRGDWLVGFGWDHSKWQIPELPTVKDLDRYFPSHPVSFVRADGHTSWLNSEALKRVGNLEAPQGGEILRDSQGNPTGIFIDTAKICVDRFIPAYQNSQLEMFLQKAVQIFNRAGITHIRDMTATPLQFDLWTRLNQPQMLSLATELYFVIDELKDLQPILDFIQDAKKRTTENTRIRGIKVFFDGALGSEGAYLSQNYLGRDSRGKVAWSKEEIQEILRTTWTHKLECAFHTIGDEAVHLIATWTNELYQQGVRGPLTFEHAELIRPETLVLLKTFQTEVHMQPCHWLTDRAWLQSKLGKLMAYAFPWQAVEESGIPLYFGSDSPIEKPSLADNFYAITEAEKTGIATIRKNFVHYHQHPLSQWCSSRSIFENGQCTQLEFMSKKIF